MRHHPQISGFLSITPRSQIFSLRWGPSSDGYQHHVAIRALWEQPEHLLLLRSYRSARGFVTQSRNVCREMRGADILSARERRKVSRRITLGWLFLAVLRGSFPPPRKKESKEPAKVFPSSIPNLAACHPGVGHCGPAPPNQLSRGVGVLGNKKLQPSNAPPAVSEPKHSPRAMGRVCGMGGSVQLGPVGAISPRHPWVAWGGPSRGSLKDLGLRSEAPAADPAVGGSWL